MDAIRFDQLSRMLGRGSRRAVLGALAAGGLAALFGPPTPADAASKCKKRNWCVNRSHTCGPVDKHGKCLIEVFGGNVCGEILFQVSDCAQCEPPNCANCRCALAAGGGDRCNNGKNGFDFICVRRV